MRYAAQVIPDPGNDPSAWEDDRRRIEAFTPAAPAAGRYGASVDQQRAPCLLQQYAEASGAASLAA